MLTRKLHSKNDSNYTNISHSGAVVHNKSKICQLKTGKLIIRVTQYYLACRLSRNCRKYIFILQQRTKYFSMTKFCNFVSKCMVLFTNHEEQSFLWDANNCSDVKKKSGRDSNIFGDGLCLYHHRIFSVGHLHRYGVQNLTLRSLFHYERATQMSSLQIVFWVSAL